MCGCRLERYSRLNGRICLSRHGRIAALAALKSTKSLGVDEVVVSESVAGADSFVGEELADLFDGLAALCGQLSEVLLCGVRVVVCGPPQLQNPQSVGVEQLSLPSRRTNARCLQTQISTVTVG